MGYQAFKYRLGDFFLKELWRCPKCDTVHRKKWNYKNPRPGWELRAAAEPRGAAATEHLFITGEGIARTAGRNAQKNAGAHGAAGETRRKNAGQDVPGEVGYPIRGS